MDDPREAYRVRHELRDIIILTIRAVKSGADDFVTVAEYGALKETWLRRFLKLLEVSGCIVTIDATGGQTAIAAKIVEWGADYVLAVKENQPTLAADVAAFFAAPKRKTDRTLLRLRPMAEKDHDRIEQQRIPGRPVPVDRPSGERSPDVRRKPARCPIRRISVPFVSCRSRFRFTRHGFRA